MGKIRQQPLDFEKALEYFTRIGDLSGQARMKAFIGLQADGESASESFESALAIFEQLGDHAFTGRVLNYRGINCLKKASITTSSLVVSDHHFLVRPPSLGRLETSESPGANGSILQAKDDFINALHTFEIAGDDLGKACQLNNIGFVNAILGLFSDAKMAFDQGMRLIGEIGNKQVARAISQTMRNVIPPSTEESDLDRARAVEDFDLTVSSITYAIAKGMLEMNWVFNPEEDPLEVRFDYKATINGKEVSFPVLLEEYAKWKAVVFIPFVMNFQESEGLTAYYTAKDLAECIDNKLFDKAILLLPKNTKDRRVFDFIESRPHRDIFYYQLTDEDLEEMIKTALDPDRALREPVSKIYEIIKTF
jgi:hypothetical protein